MSEKNDINYATDRKYAETHEWVKMEGDLAVIGISDYAQGALGDVVFVELPKVGATFKAGHRSASWNRSKRRATSTHRSAERSKR
jgi:glycine cleavage system H lipoate-binding protein